VGWEGGICFSYWSRQVVMDVLLFNNFWHHLEKTYFRFCPLQQLKTGDHNRKGAANRLQHQYSTM
jgi:hypothetical protein